MDWDAILHEFHSQRTTREVNRALDSWGLNDRTLAAHFDYLAAPTLEPRSSAERRRVLSHLWRSAIAGRAGGSFLLAFALYAECQWAWELSARPHRLVRFLKDVCWSWQHSEASDLLPPSEFALTDALVSHTADLERGTDMENGLNCSCPVTTSKESLKIVENTTALLADLVPADDDLNAERDVLESVLHAHQQYFRGVHRASTVFLQVLSGAPDPEDLARRTAAELQDLTGQKPLSQDVYASELRSHIVALECLADRLRSTELGRLRMPSVAVTYVYSFTLQGVPTARLLDQAREHADALAADPGSPVQRIEETDLTDIWKHGRSEVLSDRDRHPYTYEAVSVLLPEIVVTDSTGRTLSPHRTELRLSALGNHHLRITTEVTGSDLTGAEADADYHALNQAIRRGSGFMGAETFQVPGGEPASTLSELARRMLSKIPEWASAAELPPLTLYADVTVDSHTIVTIGHAEIRGLDGTRTANGGDLLSALGPMLVVPVERAAAGLEEWLRYDDPAPAEVVNFLGEFAPLGSLAVQNARTTVIYAPGQPDWSMLGTREMVEFVASVRALLRQWLREVQDAVERATGILRERIEGRSRPASELAHLRLELADVAVTVRNSRARLHAEELARSTGHRQIMDRMLVSSDADRLENELDQRIEQLDAVFGQLSEDARTVEERQINLILFLLALLSLGDLIGLSNDLVFEGGPPPLLRALELGLFVVLVASLGWVGWRVYRR